VSPLGLALLHYRCSATLLRPATAPVSEAARVIIENEIGPQGSLCCCCVSMNRSQAMGIASVTGRIGNMLSPFNQLLVSCIRLH